MQNKNTRRGQTQLVLKNNPVNIPELVSGSSTQAVTQQSPQRQALKMPKQVRQYSYLTRACGFTLIELLVVVLIIGILAAVALPQYQKTIRKMRFSANTVIFNTLSKAMDAYVLEHGYPTDENVWFTGSYSNVLDRLDIKIPWTSCDGNYCFSTGDAGWWGAYCTPSSCRVYLWESSVMGCSIKYSSEAPSFEWKVDLMYCDAISKEQCRLLRHFFGTHRMSETLQTKCTALGA